MRIQIRPNARRETPLTSDDVRYFLRNSLDIIEQPKHIEHTPEGFEVSFNSDMIQTDGGVFADNDMVEVPASLGLPSQFIDSLPLYTPIPLTNPEVVFA